MDRIKGLQNIALNLLYPPIVYQEGICRIHLQIKNES